MITSTLFRHGLIHREAKRLIRQRLERLEYHAPAVTRINIVLEQVPRHGQANRLYQCHISLRAVGRRSADVYVNNGSIGSAVADAFDQISDLIKFKGLGGCRSH